MRTHPSSRLPARSAMVFAALGDATRLGVIARLSAQGPLSITQLAEGSKVTRQAVTKHLKTLESAGLVKGSREGRENLWTLEPQGLAEARRYMDAISQEWDDRLSRLRELVER